MTATSLDQMATFHVGFDIWTGKARLTVKSIRLGSDGEVALNVSGLSQL